LCGRARGVGMLRSFFGLLVSLLFVTAALAQAATTTTGPSSGAGATAAASDSYHLGAGDKLRVIVFGEASLSGEFIVPGGAGTIAFPLVGDVKASGLSVPELQAEISDKLRDGYLKDPRVSIEVLTYRPYYILGEVAKPGQYSYTNGLTVLNAVATANGFTYRANTHKVYIKRSNSTHEVELDLKSTTMVEPGDTIRVAERFF
jgi:protein involved in polysaccharide export with SLBB domain